MRRGRRPSCAGRDAGGAMRGFFAMAMAAAAALLLADPAGAIEHKCGACTGVATLVTDALEKEAKVCVPSDGGLSPFTS